MAIRNRIFGKFRRIFESYGYGEVWTPAFEDFELLAKKSGASIEEEIYAFQDKGGRKLGLRFDPTVPIARIVATDSSMPKPIKFYYITNMWRYDRPQAGRYREFWQAGLELIGPKESAEADAEILAVANDLLTSVCDREFTFKISSRKALDAIAEKAGIDEEKRKKAFIAVDKLAKIGNNEVAEEMKKAGISDKTAAKFFDLIEKQDTDLTELKKIKAIAEKLGVKNVEIDLSIVRGFDYYTGFVFETFAKGDEPIGSVCSGGRYDELIKIYGGEDLGATGFGLGIDRLLDIIGYEEEYSSVKVFVAPVNDETREYAFEIAAKLRKEGVSAETDLMKRSLRKQFDYMNSKNIPYALIIGPKEMTEKKLTLRNMETGEEKKLGVEEIKSFFG